MSGDAGAFSECEVNTLIKPDRTTIQVSGLGRVEPELVVFLRMALSRDATRRHRFVVNAAVWVHSMVLHGRTEEVT